jgi:hypothetical protein
VAPLQELLLSLLPLLLLLLLLLLRGLPAQLPGPLPAGRQLGQQLPARCPLLQVHQRLAPTAAPRHCLLQEVLCHWRGPAAALRCQRHWRRRHMYRRRRCRTVGAVPAGCRLLLDALPVLLQGRQR